MTWYSFVFPNTALMVRSRLSTFYFSADEEYKTATFAVGKALDNKPIRIVGCVLTCLLILLWMYVFVNMILAVIHQQVMWPQMQEDRDEGGWKSEAEQNYGRDVQKSKQNADGLRHAPTQSDVRGAND